MLAEKLGWQSVERMRREMSSAEWQNWRIYYSRKWQRQEMAAAQAKG